MLAPAVIGTIRTAVPVGVAAVILWLTGLGLDLSSQQSLWDEAIITATTAGYYGLATFLERKVNPMFGLLLGYPKAPQAYSAQGRHEAV